jgi:hypothetical protein
MVAGGVCGLALEILLLRSIANELLDQVVSFGNDSDRGRGNLRENPRG